jgi:hypothetical protein
MSYKVPSLDEMSSILVAFWKGLFPLSNVGSRFSYHWKRLRAYAGGITDLHAHVDSAQRDIMPDTSTGAYLTRWGAIFGVPKKGATGARKAASFAASGTPGSVVLVNDQLLHESSGFLFQVFAGGTIPSGGTLNVGIQAISTGAATRLKKGEALKFTAPQPGITAYGSLVLDLDEDGFDAEQDPAFSRRVNDRAANASSGGNQYDFTAWSLAQLGISAAFCYPNRAGVGTVDVAAFKTGDGASRSLTSTERAALLTALKKLAPAQLAPYLAIGGAASVVAGALRVLTTSVDLQHVEITFLTNGDDAYAFDWNDSTAPVVLAYTSGTRLVQFTAARPSDMLAGGRIIFKPVGSAQRGEVFTIESLSSTDSIVLKETPSVNIATNDIAYAGGPLTKQIRDAIVAHMNGEIVYADKGAPLPASSAASKVNMRTLAYGIGPPNPFGATTAAPQGLYGTWNGSLLRGELAKLAAYSLGVRNVTVVTPAADYLPTDTVFPNDGTQNYIGPNSVIVRRAWT